MVRKLIITLFLSLPALLATSQDFKLYFANNVTDVSDFSKITKSGSGLQWREVGDGDADGNSYEVDQLKQMLASTPMKGLAQQQQFWRMRDHTLLCFRIDDDASAPESYLVELTESDSGQRLTLTTMGHFFVNAPLMAPPSTEYAITMTRLSDPTQKKRFKYTVFDWDNSSLYIFQLDRKRQLDGKEYAMEYVTGYMDEEGYVHSDTTQLQLRSKSFQSLYVPKGSDLLDVVLMGDGNKLRINKKRLHPGIDLEDRYSRMALSPAFNLDRHQDREFVNFNWLGTGLFEKYDTLYLQLINQRGVPIRRATINVEQVDAGGEPTGSGQVRYFGYDDATGLHKVITMGKPAYVEILAAGYLPIVYRYAGAADDETGFVSEDRCSATITLKQGRYDEEGIVITEQSFLNLHDEKAIVVRGGVDHELCTVDEVDLSAKLPVDTVAYFEDCGMDYPKLLDNKTIEHYAQIQASFSRPTGLTAPDCLLFATDLDSKATKQATDKEVRVLAASKYRKFTRDYYFVRFNLVDVIERDHIASLRLTAGNMNYEGFPKFYNVVANRAEDQKSGEKEVKEKFTGGDDNQAATGLANAGYDLKLPVQLKINFSPVMVTTSVEADFRKQLIDIKVNLAVGRDTAQRANETKEMSQARKELKAQETYEANTFDMTDGVKQSFISDKVKLQGDNDFQKWVYSQADDIFGMNSNRVGQGWFGGGKFELKCSIADKKRKVQVTNASGNVGYGLGMSTNDLGNGSMKKLIQTLKKFENIFGFSINGAFEISTEAEMGIKSFDKKVQQNWNSLNQGYYFKIGARLRTSATVQLSTPQWLNAAVNVQAGLRVGGKLGVQFGLEGPFSSVAPGAGLELSAVAMGQAFVNVRTFIFHWSGSAGFAIGAQGLIPNNDHNPFHKDFPYWMQKDKARPGGTIFKSAEVPVVPTFGRVLVDDVAIDANPHFLDGNAVVYNDLKDPADYDDDQVTLMEFDGDPAEADDNGQSTTAKAQSLSATGTTATNHMRSKRGSHEIVVYEQMADRVGTPDAEHAVSFNSEAMKLTRLRASMRHTDGGAWQQTPISDETMDEGWADLKPVVTIQDDGHAACVYQHGQIGVADTTVSADSLDNMAFSGQLMLKTWDGNAWSKATPLFDINDGQRIGQYDLIMRGDTVLVGAIVQQAGQQKPVLRYASKPIASASVDYHDDVISPISIFMNRVGRNGVVAMLFEREDSIRDIYVQTLDMNGLGDGRVGSQLGVGYAMPTRMKIVCDREAHDLDDFAVLWTEQNNVARQDDGTATDSGWTGMKLNASRIHLTTAPQITAPITVGAETDSIHMMTDFDGFLDDAHISVVYTLANPDNGAGVIMYNDKYFRNSFEYDVSYAREALLGSTTLPVNVTIANTGTSAIQAVHVDINGQLFDIDSAYVAPLTIKNYVVQYPLTDDFDGYISSRVTVDYNNVFRARRHPRLKAMSYLSQTREQPLQRLLEEDVELNVVSRDIADGTNTFTVELTDRRQLNPGIGVRVGIYAHPAGSEPLADASTICVTPDDFVTVGTVRKAWATVSVDGVLDPSAAYVNCRLFDMEHTDENDGEVLIKNVRDGSNAFRVQLFPTADPQELTRIREHQAGQQRSVDVVRQEGGIQLANLKQGQTVRIFNLDGICIHRQTAGQGGTIAVPLSEKGVYVVSAGSEVFKLQY